MPEHPALQLFEELLAIPAPSGFEGDLARAVRRLLTERGVESEVDAAGNVLVRLGGTRPELPLVCWAAHLDEIGMVVTEVGADGALRVDRSGGLEPWKLGEGPVEILGDRDTVPGLLSMGSTHTADASKRTVDWAAVRVLTGLGEEQLAAAGVRPGSAAVPARSARGPVVFGDEADPLVAAWTFDDRMGVIALIRLLERLAREGLRPLHPTIVAFTVGEEIGGHGAKALACREKAELFIAIDGCPIPPGAPLALDGRPGIWTRDRLASYDPGMIRTLQEAARKAGTELQPVVYASTASDASMAQAAGCAPRVACFGHVRENSHGFEVARLAVFERVLETLLEALQSAFPEAG